MENATEERTPRTLGAAPAAGLEIALPPRSISLTQDREWCVVNVDGTWERVHIHDYGKIFSIPGLYELLLRDVLRCRSPETVRSLLQEELSWSGTPPRDLRVLDLGAGNGMVGEELAQLGAGSIVGLDIIEEAAEAAERDRPEVYDEYLILDMTALSEKERTHLRRRRPNCLVCVAALGFNDIPTEAFLNAYRLLPPGGWVAFNIKEEFLGESDGTGFSRLLRRLTSSGKLEVHRRRRYRHRLGTDGTPIHYVAMTGVKRGDPVPSGSNGADIAGTA